MGINGSYFLYPNLRHKVRILHYSGDTDGIVPTVGTMDWMDDLNWEITSSYERWSVRKYKPGGWKMSRDGLDLIVIHGGGHMVPQWK